VLQKSKHSNKCILSVRQLQCLKWVAEGKSDCEIAAILSLSPKTINYHLEKIKHTLGVFTRVQAVAIAIRNGWL
jgi:DNA-binding CsgD family transcriptional regulator